jgi:hypothetical protein
MHCPLSLSLKRMCIQPQGPAHHISPSEGFLLRHETQAIQQRLAHPHLKTLASGLEIRRLGNKRQKSGFRHG